MTHVTIVFRLNVALLSRHLKFALQQEVGPGYFKGIVLIGLFRAKVELIVVAAHRGGDFRGVESQDGFRAL